MEIVSIAADGEVIVSMSAQEAADVRDDIGGDPHTKVSRSGDKLHSLLEYITPRRTTAPVPAPRSST